MISLNLEILEKLLVDFTNNAKIFLAPSALVMALFFMCWLTRAQRKNQICTVFELSKKSQGKIVFGHGKVREKSGKLICTDQSPPWYDMCKRRLFLVSR